MRKIFGKILSLSLLVTLTFTGCNENTNTPINPDQGQEQEETQAIKPVAAEITLYRGHFHTPHALHQDPWSVEIKHYKYPQTMKLNLVDNVWKIADDSPMSVFVVEGGKSKPQDKDFGFGSLYGFAFLIHYYDQDGNLLDGKFYNADVVNQYQHFFIANDIGTIEENTPLDYTANRDFYNYEYMDTNPWNKTIKTDNAERIGDKNPVGFKGYFGFFIPDAKFNINVRLMHHSAGKFVDGAASPFNAPTEPQLGKSIVDMQIPFITIKSFNGYLEAEEWETYKGEPTEDYTAEIQAKDQRLVKRLMDAFNISEKDAFDDAYNLLWDSRKEDPSVGFWF